MTALSSGSKSAPVWMLVAFAGLSLGLSTPLPAAQPENGAAAARTMDKGGATDDAALPVGRITLYRSGVGYFERSGTVSDNSDLHLRFATDQINDILKSLVALDLGGGKVDSVSYASKEPLNKRLASFGINIADNPSANELLKRLRGTEVRITAPDGEFTGTILNVEDRATIIEGGPSRPTAVHQLPWINLVTPKGVKSVNLATSTGFEILDKDLAAELNKALGALAEYRADRSKTVDLRFTGAGQRRVMVGYVHEMPVWKTSYRLVLPDLDAAGATKGKPTLQGWAVVENTTDQDWNNVELGLVSGRPVSFQMDLYEPLFAGRPWVAVPTIPGVAPRIFGLGVDADQLAEGEAAGRSADAMTGNAMQAQSMARSGSIIDFKKLERGDTAGFSRAGAPAPTAAPAKPYGGVSAQEMVDYGAKSQADGVSVGEVFQFQVQTPVSIERQRSAMIPIVTAPITGRRVSIFNAADGSKFPMRGLELTNDSGVALLPGPVSVFDGSAYAGDAQIGQTPKADKRLLAYALDLDVPVLNSASIDSTILKLVISNGTVYQSIKERRTTTYEFANKDTQRGRTLILEHAKLSGYDLVDTAKPDELTPDLYRFNVALEAGKAKTFKVVQERTVSESLAVIGFDLARLSVFQREGKMSQAVADAIRKAGQMQTAINQTETQISEANKRIGEISKDQQRIRENMGAIDRTSQLYAKYVARLTEQETILDSERENIASLQKKVQQQRDDLATYLRELNVQ